jgi:hypothetical protein
MFERNEKPDSKLTSELAALERQLAGLVAAPLHVDRDRLMFEAGRTAGRAQLDIAATQCVAGAPRWFWPTATAMSAAACLVLSAMLVWRGDAASVAQQGAKPQAVGLAGIQARTGEGSDEVDRVTRVNSAQDAFTRPISGYLETRHIALTRGLGELRPESHGDISIQPGAVRPAATARELLRELVPSRVVSSPNS